MSKRILVVFTFRSVEHLLAEGDGAAGCADDAVVQGKGERGEAGGMLVHPIALLAARFTSPSGPPRRYT